MENTHYMHNSIDFLEFWSPLTYIVWKRAVWTSSQKFSFCGI